jgi:hypothetical protein
MSQTKSGVSAATRWDFECNGDKYYKVTLWDNGGDGVVEHKVSGKSRCSEILTLGVTFTRLRRIIADV